MGGDADEAVAVPCGVAVQHRHVDHLIEAGLTAAAQPASKSSSAADVSPVDSARM
jgi:hypothetical protein